MVFTTRLFFVIDCFVCIVHSFDCFSLFVKGKFISVTRFWFLSQVRKGFSGNSITLIWFQLFFLMLVIYSSFRNVILITCTDENDNLYSYVFVFFPSLFDNFHTLHWSCLLILYFHYITRRISSFVEVRYLFEIQKESYCFEDL